MKKLTASSMVLLILLSFAISVNAQQQHPDFKENTLHSGRPDKEINREKPKPPYPIDLLGLQENQEKLDLNVYPNPCNGTFTLSLNEHKRSVNIRIIDLTGKEIFSKTLRPEATTHEIKMNLDHLKAGIYLIRANNEAKRLMIQ